MFKRYTKNPFEKEMPTQEMENDNAEYAPRPMARSTAVVDDRQQTASSFNTPIEEAYSQEIPSRVFEGRGSQQSASLHPSMNQEHTQRHESESFVLAEEDSWPEKIAPLPSAPFQLENFDGEEPETVLGEGVTFKGELSFKRFLRIDGQFEGELNSEGKLVIGPRGVVKSNVKMREVIVEGYVEGNIIVDERIELRGDAQVYGDISAKILSVDEGVTVVGNLSIRPGSSSFNSSENVGKNSEEK